MRDILMKGNKCITNTHGKHYFILIVESYAGILESNQLRSPTMTCPHCGYKTMIKLKKGFGLKKLFTK